MSIRKRFTAGAMALAMVFAMSFQMPYAKAANEVKVDILQINDFHGSLKEDGKNVGAAKLVNEIKKAKATNPNTIAVSAGDNYQGSAPSNLLYGEPVAQVMKEAGIVATATGNHEFDWGLDKFEQWKKISNIPFLAANVYDKTTNKPVAWADPYKIIDVNGVKVGIIGLTTQATAYTTKPQNVETIEFKNPVEVANEFVPKVKKEGADIVVLLCHIGATQDKTTKQITLEVPGLVDVKGVDGIILGHSHQIVSGVINNIPVVEGYYNGRTLGKLSFTIDKDKKEILKKESSVDTLYERKDTLKDDEATKKIVDSYIEKVGPILNEVVGKTQKDLNHDKNKLSDLGQWSTDVMKKSANADIAVINGGGLRTNIPAGDITVGKMYEVMPFDNVLALFEMNGAQIKEVFENGIENKELGDVQFSGVKVTYIPGAEKGKKVVKMTLDNGKDIEMDKIYKVVANDFMASGGDGYTVFKKAKALGETMPIRDALIQEIKTAKTLNYISQERLVKNDNKVETVKVDPIKEDKPKVEVKKEQPAKPEVIAVKPTVEKEIKKVSDYTVVKGDTLNKIGKKFNTTWKKIADFNKMQNPNKIKPGQKILIPAA